MTNPIDNRLYKRSVSKLDREVSENTAVCTQEEGYYAVTVPLTLFYFPVDRRVNFVNCVL